MIYLDSVSLEYAGKPVLNDFSLEIKEKEKVVILGPSGAGKTSIFSLILGFIDPSRGEMYFHGKRIDDVNIWAIRREIAFVDQKVSIGPGKVSDWISFVGQLRANSNIDFSMKNAVGKMNYFDMSQEVLSKDIEELSGGEKQRLAIIVSLMLGRKVFFLDEVTSSLDKSLKKKVTRYFFREKEWTVVSISHDSAWLEYPEVKVFDMGTGKWKQ